MKKLICKIIYYKNNCFGYNNFVKGNMIKIWERKWAKID